MELKYTPTTINEIEVENGNKSFTTLLGDIRLKMLALWVKKGLGLSSDKEAFDEMQKYFDTGKSLEDLMVEIFEALQKGGFLDKSKDIRQALKEAQEKQTQGAEKGVSEKKV